MIFFSDLDGTIIYSKRHDIGTNKICVEYIDGEEFAYVTPNTIPALKRINEQIMFVPITTRTSEHFSQVNLNEIGFRYSLTCNGGVLYKDGVKDEAWYNESMKIMQECRSELEKAQNYMENMKESIFPVYWVDDLFIYSKSSNPTYTQTELEKIINLDKVMVNVINAKIYVLPVQMSKRHAIARFIKYFRLEDKKIITAGDTGMDCPMASIAHVSIYPHQLNKPEHLDNFPDLKNSIFMHDKEIYVEQILKYVSDYILQERSLFNWISIAKRQNNNKRNFLLVNREQAKHVPAKPHQTLALLEFLATKVASRYNNEQILVIGFAETATAIGSVIAIKLDSFYIQTTRENIADVEFIEFSEEHSHATEQKIVKGDIDKVITKIDRIIFAEDEVTTGNTILNIINQLERRYSSNNISYSVATLINGMNTEYKKNYLDKGIEVHAVYEKSFVIDSSQIDSLTENNNYFEPSEDVNSTLVKTYINNNLINPRRITTGSLFKQSCKALWEQLPDIIGDNILILGTEELMYPAIYIGAELEKLGKNVLCHATTRSPICVSDDTGYILQSRFELKSCYDASRTTFIYQITKYDQVIIITDGNDQTGINTLISALQSQGNDNILLQLIR